MGIRITISTAGDTIDLQGSGYKVLDGYYPIEAASQEQPVVEQIRLEIIATAGQSVSAKLQALGRKLEHARAHKTDADGCYANFSADTAENLYRSRITDGYLMLDGRLSRYWKASKVLVTLVIERAPYWEGIEAQIPLTNGNGTDNTTGLAVYNHDDAGAGHDNYVQIAAANVEGDLPGATRLEITNNYATGLLYDLWIGQTWTDPANLVHILEGEDSSVGADQVNAAASGGYFTRTALSSGSEAELFNWTLSAAFLNACKGRFYKLLARFHNMDNLTSVRFRLRIQYQVTTIWQSGQVSLDATRAIQIRDLFTLRLPPWLPEQTGLLAIQMSITGQQSTGSPINVDLDFLEVCPVDGWRQITPVGYGVAQNQRVIDDGIGGALYVDDGSGTGKIGILTGYGAPVMLQPGKLQRLYFLMHSASINTAEIARTISVKLFYRPRRQSL